MTPKPWTKNVICDNANEVIIEILGPGGEDDAHVALLDFWVDDEASRAEVHADADVMVATPDMFDALMSVSTDIAQAHLENPTLGEGEVRLSHASVLAVRAALYKAGGGK